MNFLARKEYVYYTASDIEFLKKFAKEKDAENERIVVVDDIHLIRFAEERERSYEILEKLASDHKVWLILISRCNLPGWLKPLYVQQLFLLITEKEMALSIEEEEIFLQQWGIYLQNKSSEYLRKIGKGYPLFLRITALKLICLDKNYEDFSDRLRQEQAAIEEGKKDCCDYLENYVIDQWDIELQEFLTDLAIVEEFDVRLAQIITKKNDVGRLILMAQELGNYIIEHNKKTGMHYELIPLIKTCLKKRLKYKYSQTYIDDLYYSAGSGYELQGSVIQALKMYKKAHNKEAVCRILVENSRKHPGSGYYWELRNYYLELPEEMIRKSPELMAGMCMLQSISMNDEESERWYHELAEYSKSQSGNKRELIKMRLLYLDLGLPHRKIYDIPEKLKHISSIMGKIKVTLPELPLTNNQPSQIQGGKDFSEWCKRDREIAECIGSLLETIMGKLGRSIINLALAESLFEKREDDYEVSLLAEKGRIQAESSRKAEVVFVAVGILAQLSLFHNHLDDALESLDNFKSGVQDLPQLLNGINTLRTRFLLYAGRSAEIAEWMKSAPQEEKEFCSLERYRYITKARVYLSVGKKDKALRLLQKLIFYAEQRRRSYLLMEAELLLSITLFRMGKTNWKEYMQNAISQAEQYGFVRVLSREGVALWEILKNESFIWKDLRFKRHVMEECANMAGLYPGYLKEKSTGNIILSDKALRILRLQAEGKSVEQIAETLGLSKSGVKYYNQETYKKLGVKSKAAAITEARNRKLL